MVEKVTKRVIKKKPNKGSKAPAIIDIATKHPDLSCAEIGKMVDCSHVNVVKTLQRYGIDHEAVDKYKSQRADIFAGLGDRLLKSITDEAIKKTPAIQLVTAASILYDKERLERGQSTDRQSVIVTHIRDLQSRLRGDDVNRD